MGVRPSSGAGGTLDWVGRGTGPWRQQESWSLGGAYVFRTLVSSCLLAVRSLRLVWMVGVGLCGRQISFVFFSMWVSLAALPTVGARFPVFSFSFF